MPKKHKRAKRKPRVSKKHKPKVIHPVNPQHQYHAVHNNALKNFTRDTAHAEKIKTRLKEDVSLTEHKIADLMKQRGELIKH